jgi:hydrogenase/urease accessory protein HupE
VHGAQWQRRWWAAGLLIFLVPAGAEAHTAVKGMSSFMSGALHPVLTPAHVLVLLGLGLMIGQHVPLRLGLAVGAFAPTAAVGLAVTTTGAFTAVHPAVLSLVAFCLGGFVAWGRQLPVPVCSLSVAAGAMVLGMDSGVESGGAKVVIETLGGTWVSLNILFLSLIYYVSLAAEAQKQWLAIGIRVAGSWILAISVLMLAFALRK